MNTIILAGGYAERLWPITENYPKTLLKIAGKPVLYHLLKNVIKIPELTELIIAIDEEKSSFFEDNLNSINIGASIRPKLSIHYSRKNGEIKGPIEKIYEIINSHEFELESEDTLIVGGDNIFGFDLSKFYNFFKTNNANCNAVHKYTQSADASQFGVPTITSSGQITKLMEKPKRHYRLASTACYLFKREILEKTESYIKRYRDDSLGNFINWLVTNTKIIAFEFEENWYDIGTREGLLSANAFLLKSSGEKMMPNLVQGEIEIIPPVYLEEDIIVSKSKIGPNVYIAKKTQIENSVIQNSIIYESSKIKNCFLRDSVIGQKSTIEGNVSEAVIGPKSLLIRD